MIVQLLVMSVLMGPSAAPADLPADVVGVCVTPSGWEVVWHPLSSKENVTAFRMLGGTDFDACLRRSVTTDPDLAKLASTISVDASPDVNLEAIRAIQERWRALGVYSALEEVMTTGQRGPNVAEFLKRCERQMEESN